jgi:GT2 family glycosyltransferase
MNVGIAKSLNEGISIADRKGFRWVLTLDDDTIAEPDLVENLTKMWRLAAGQDKRAIAIWGWRTRNKHGKADLSGRSHILRKSAESSHPESDVAGCARRDRGIPRRILY